VSKIPPNDKIKKKLTDLLDDLKKAEEFAKELLIKIKLDILTNLFNLFKIIIKLVDDIVKDLSNDSDPSNSDPSKSDPSNSDPSTNSPSSSGLSSSSSSSSSSVVTGQIVYDTAPNINTAQLQMMASTIIAEGSSLACLTPAPGFSLVGSLCGAAAASSGSSAAYPSGGSTNTYANPGASTDTYANPAASTDIYANPEPSTVIVTVNPPSSTTTVVVVVTQTPPPFGVITPSGHGIDCHTDVDYTDLSACYNIDLSLIKPDTVYTTNDEICYDKGSVDLDGVSIGNWCQIGYNDVCSLVWGQSPAVGISARTLRFRGQDLLDFVSLAAQKCGTETGAVISTTNQDPNLTAGGWDMSFCLVSRGSEAACGNNQGFPQP
jgi:hypothetical protein